MNIQINTTEKTIKLQESVNLGELAEVLNKLFPKNEWKEFKLETNTIINNWSNPIIIERQSWPVTYPWVTYNDFTIAENSGSGNFTCSSGTYNLSIN